MWVEVVGLPGIGKSTVIGRQLPVISQTHEIVTSKTPNLLQRVYARYLYVSRYRGCVDDPRLARKLAYRAGFRLFRRNRENIFFFDSGMLQVIVEYLIETDFTRLEATLSLVPQLSIHQTVLYFTDNLEDIVGREFNRGSRRFDLSEEELKIRYARASEIIVNKMLPQLSNVHQMKISGFTKEKWRAIIKS